MNYLDMVALARRMDGERRALWVEMGALMGGALGVLAFVSALLLQEVV
jgi:hypothetical protein